MTQDIEAAVAKAREKVEDAVVDLAKWDLDPVLTWWSRRRLDPTKSYGALDVALDHYGKLMAAVARVEALEAGDNLIHLPFFRGAGEIAPAHDLIHEHITAAEDELALLIEGGAK
ncbi:MAG TPA: hypothetical protein VF981_16540 [Gemmatimonadaceae bacterium]